jgi:hypothetical protein
VQFAPIALPVLVTLAGLFQPADAKAAVGGTGTSTSTIDITGPPPYPMTGTITWNDETRDVFGHDVNPGTSVGTMSVTGMLSVVVPGTGTYTGTADGSPGLSFQGVDGAYLSIGSSLSSFVNRVVGLTGDGVGADPSDLPPDGATIAYTQDGVSSCSTVPGAVICSGTQALNVFEAVATSTTPPGAGNISEIIVDTSFFNPITGTEVPVTVFLGPKVTSPGHTQVTATSSAAGSIASHFAIELGGWKSVFFDITTTASFTFPIRVGTWYPDANDDGVVDGTESVNGGISECDLRLLHKEGSSFKDVTMRFDNPNCGAIDACPGDAPRCIDPVDNFIEGRTSGLSPFVVAAQLSPAPIPALSPHGALLLGAGLALTGAAWLAAASRLRRAR